MEKIEIEFDDYRALEDFLQLARRNLFKGLKFPEQPIDEFLENRFNAKRYGDPEGMEISCKYSLVEGYGFDGFKRAVNKGQLVPQVY